MTASLHILDLFMTRADYGVRSLHLLQPLLLLGWEWW
jgi:hypothetical protein